MKQKTAKLSRNAVIALSLLLLVSLAMNVVLVFFFKPTSSLIFQTRITTKSEPKTKEEPDSNVSTLQSWINKLVDAKKTKDGKLELTRAEIDSLYDGFTMPRDSFPTSTTWNKDQPNQWVEYESKALGLTMRVPYNNKWGNDKIALAPAEDFVTGNEKEILFGSLGYFTCAEGCGWTNQYSISETELLSSEQIMDRVTKNSTIPEKPPLFEKMRIGKHDVLKVSQYYEAYDIGYFTTYFVLGTKHNLELNPGWYGYQLDEASAKKILEGIVIK